jgi:hypothetical protein
MVGLIEEKVVVNLLILEDTQVVVSGCDTKNFE